MTVSNNINTNKLLKRLANHLIINSSFLDDLGLLHGKMGIVIFFYHYYRYTNNSIYKEFAAKLLHEIYEDIHDNLPIDFKNGYLGIGWGIEHIFYEQFIDGDTNNILEDIDTKIMEFDIRRVTNIGLNKGLEGYLHYILARVQKNKDISSLFDKQYFTDLLTTINKLYNKNKTKDLEILIEIYINFYNNNVIEYSPSSVYLKKMCRSFSQNMNNMYGSNIGLVNGSAGLGLKILL